MNRSRLRQTYFAVWLLAITIPLGAYACAGQQPPNLPPEAALSADGKKLAGYITLAAEGVDILFESKKAGGEGLTAQEAYNVMKPLNIAAGAGSDLNKALAAIYRARTEAEGKVAKEQARVALQAARDALNDSFKLVPTDSKAATQIKSGLSLALSIMNVLSLPVGKLNDLERELMLNLPRTASTLQAMNYAQLPVGVGGIFQILLPLFGKMYDDWRKSKIKEDPANADKYPPADEVFARSQLSWNELHKLTGELAEKYKAEGAIDQ